VVNDTSNLIVEHLKAIRAEIASVKADTVEIKERLRSHDASIIELRRADVHAFEDQARQQVSIDALTRRIESIESRLELI